MATSVGTGGGLDIAIDTNTGTRALHIASSNSIAVSMRTSQQCTLSHGVFFGSVGSGPGHDSGLLQRLPVGERQVPR